MMRILILIIMLLPCSLGMYASAIDSLLSVLDKTIVMRRQYEEEKERYISLIKDELKQGIIHLPKFIFPLLRIAFKAFMAVFKPPSA